ncbi:AAA family ATPase, partial [Cysteiniphilum sp. SYW-8]
RDYLINLRKSWEISVNQCLGYHNISQRVCADSYRKQGIDLDGVSYDGYGGSVKQQLEAQQKINGEKLLESPQLVLAALNARDATFTKNDMIAFVNRHSLPEQAENVLKRVICHEQFVDLGNGRFTSLDYLKSEKQLLSSAIALNQQGSHSIDHAFANDMAAKMTLNDSQRCAFDYTLAENSSIKNIIGMAGTGKSHLIKAVSAVYQQSGYRVKGLALSGIVAANLSLDADISDSKTLHAFLSSYQGGNEVIDEKTVLVVDEASLIGTKQLSEVVKLVETHHAKLILVGDNQQLQAINAGGAYRGVINATTHIGLDEIQRQRNEQDKLASLQLATGEVS